MQAVSGLGSSFAWTNCLPSDLADWKETEEWKNDYESERPLVRIETAGRPTCAGCVCPGTVSSSSSSVAQVCGACVSELVSCFGILFHV
jgi:hypothetical protein